MDEFDALVPNNQEDQPVDEFEALIPKPSSFLRRGIGDPLASLAKGVLVGIPETAIGLANIPTMGYAGKGVDVAAKAIFGGGLKEAGEAMDKSLLSPETQEAKQKVAEAQGFIPTLTTALQNPSAIVSTIAESAPSMIGGAGIGRKAMSVMGKAVAEEGIPAAVKMSRAITAGAIGEGAISAGQNIEQVRQEAEGGTLTPIQVATMTGSGFVTGLISRMSGGLARRLGITDIDTLMQGVNTGAGRKGVLGVIRGAIESAITEGAFEELPQSAQEQMAQNVALGKPLMENVANAGAMGLLSGAGMGIMGFGAGRILRPTPVEQALATDPIEKNINELAATMPEESKIVEAPIAAINDTKVENALAAAVEQSQTTPNIPPAETVAEQPAAAYEQEAATNGVTFRGMQEGIEGEPSIPAYEHPTLGNIMVGEGETLAQKIADRQTEWDRVEKMKAEQEAAKKEVAPAADVFTRMPVETLRSQAATGVQGAIAELTKRSEMPPATATTAPFTFTPVQENTFNTVFAKGIESGTIPFQEVHKSKSAKHYGTPKIVQYLESKGVQVTDKSAWYVKKEGKPAAQPAVATTPTIPPTAALLREVDTANPTVAPAERTKLAVTRAIENTTKDWDVLLASKSVTPAVHGAVSKMMKMAKDVGVKISAVTYVPKQRFLTDEMDITDPKNIAALKQYGYTDEEIKNAKRDTFKITGQHESFIDNAGQQWEEIEVCLDSSEYDIWHEFTHAAEAAGIDLGKYGANAEARAVNLGKRLIAGEEIPELQGMMGKIAELAKFNPNGFTIDISTGNMQTTGYAVSPAKDTETRVDIPTWDNIEAFLDKFQSVFEADKRAFLGGWLDSKTNQFVLDISFVVDSLEDALYIGDIGNQDAIFHLDNQEEIRREDGIAKLKKTGVYNEGRRSELRGIQESVLAALRGREVDQAESGTGTQLSVTRELPRRTGVAGREQVRGELAEVSGRASGKVLPGQAAINSGVHYSQQERTSLDSSFYGTGKSDAAMARLPADRTSPLWQRIYIYYEGKGKIYPEYGVGPITHNVDLSKLKLYDITSGKIQVDRIMGENPANTVEKAILDAGFDGFASPDYNAVVLLGKRTVPVTPATNLSITKLFEFQDNNQEKIIHSGWDYGNNYRYVLEGTGDVFRETIKVNPDYGYISEKLDRIERHIKDERRGIHPDDSFETSLNKNSDKFSEMEKLWDKQPTLSDIQQVAVKLNKTMLKGNFNLAEKYIRDIKSFFEKQPQFSISKLNLPPAVKSAIGTISSTISNHPEDIPKSAIDTMNEAIKDEKGKSFSGWDYALNIPFRFSQKYAEWREMWRIHGIERQENRSNMRSDFIKVAEPFFNMQKELKAKGYTKTQIRESKERINRVLIAGDIQLHDRLLALRNQPKSEAIKQQIAQLEQLRRYSDEELTAGITDEYGNTIKLNPDEIKIYTSVRSALDHVMKVMVDWFAAQSLRTYKTHKWYNMLLAATGMEMNVETLQNLLGKKGLNAVAIQKAKKLQVKIAPLFERLEEGIAEVPTAEAADVGAMYLKIAQKMQGDLSTLKEYLGELTGVKDNAELTKFTQELFTAYVKTRPQLKVIKQLRNSMNDWIGYFPRYRGEGKFKVKLFENVLDDDDNIALDDSGVPIEPREVYSSLYNNKYEGTEKLKEIYAKYGKDGKLDDKYFITHDPIGKSPESAFQGVSDINIQKIFDDTLENFRSRGIKGLEDTYIDERGNEVSVIDQLRSAGYESIANQFKSRGAMRATIHRQVETIKGYEESDLQNVLLNYMSTMAGLMTKQSAAMDAMELLKGVKNPSMFDGLAKYNREMLRNESAADRLSGKVRSMAFMWFLGGLLKAPIINLTQNPIVGFGELAKYQREHNLGGFGKADLMYMKAMKDVLSGNLSAEEKTFIDKLVTSGIATDQYIQSVFENVRENNTMKLHMPIAKFLAKPFSISEAYNRKSAGIAMYRTAYKMHLDTATKSGLKGEEAIQQAQDNTFDDARTFIDNVHYAYGKSNRPLWMMTGDLTGAGMAAAYTFRGFTHNFLARQAELLSKGDFRTFAHTIMYIGLFGGLMGLPFIKDAFEWFEKYFGRSPMNVVRRTLRGIGGETLEKLGISGLPSVLGANISGSIATGLPWPIGAPTPEASVFGIWGGMAQKGVRAVEALGRGDLGRAITEASPEFLRAPRVAVRESGVGKQLFGSPGFASNARGRAMLDENGKPISMSAWEAAIKTGGFNPTEYARAKEKNQTILRLATWVNEAKNDIAVSFRIARTKGDPNAARDMSKAVVELNKDIVSRGIEQLVGRTSVAKIIQASKQLHGKKQQREMGYKRVEL
jgi:hypothetical protein